MRRSTNAHLLHRADAAAKKTARGLGITIAPSALAEDGLHGAMAEMGHKEDETELRHLLPNSEKRSFSSA